MRPVEFVLVPFRVCCLAVVLVGEVMGRIGDWLCEIGWHWWRKA